MNALLRVLISLTLVAPPLFAQQRAVQFDVPPPQYPRPKQVDLDALEMRKKMNLVLNEEMKIRRLVRFAEAGSGLEMIYSERDALAKQAQEKVETRNRSESSLKSPAETGRTILVIAMLTAVGHFEAEREMAKLQLKDFDAGEFGSAAIGSVGKLLTEGTIPFSMAGAGTMERLLSVPLKAFDSVLKNARAAPFLKTLMAGGVHTLIAFFGWELGAQLWIEASTLLVDETHRKLAENLPSLIHGALDPLDPLHEIKREAFKQLATNLFVILFLNPDLVDEWFYNAWRNRIATGDFVSLVLGMLGATTIGTTVYPGAGTILGMAFGLIGGVAAMKAPSTWKFGITRGLEEGRRLSQEAMLAGNIWKMNSAIESLHKQNIPPNEIATILNHRLLRLNLILNPFFEGLYGSNQTLKNTLMKRDIARETLKALNMSLQDEPEALDTSERGVWHHTYQQGLRELGYLAKDTGETTRYVVSGEMKRDALNNVGAWTGRKVGRLSVRLFTGNKNQEKENEEYLPPPTPQSIDELQELVRRYDEAIAIYKAFQEDLRIKIDQRLTAELAREEKFISEVIEPMWKKSDFPENVAADIVWHAERVRLLRDSVYTTFLGLATPDVQRKAYGPHVTQEFLIEKEAQATRALRDYYNAGFEGCLKIEALQRTNPDLIPQEARCANELLDKVRHWLDKT